MRHRVRALLVSGILVLACTPAEAVRPVLDPNRASVLAVDPWSDLAARPLSLPAHVAGSCPVSHEVQYVPYAGATSWSALGDGPAYPTQRATLGHPSSSAYLGIDGRSYRKVVWLVDGSYQGPVLVRGARLEDGAPLHFNDGSAKPPTELRIPPHLSVTGIVVPSGHRDVSSSFSAAGPGCYAYQIDGIGFTKQIVFRMISN